MEMWKKMFTWKGAGVMILPVRSRLALKFLYICKRLIVPFVLGLATPLRPDFGLSGFME